MTPHVYSLGALVCDLEPGTILASDPNILDKMKLCPALTGAQRDALNALLLSGDTAYGDPSSWDLQTLQDLGPLVLALNQTTLSLVAEAAREDFRRSIAAAYIRQGHSQREKSLILLRALAAASAASQPRLQRSADRCLYGPITARNIENIILYLSPEELDQLDPCLSNDVLIKNLEAVLDLPINTEASWVLKKKVDEFFQGSGIPEQQLRRLGVLSRLYTEQEISQWPVTSSDTLSALLSSSGGEWNDSQVQQLVSRYLALGGSLTGPLLQEIGGRRLCNLQEEQIQQIPAGAIRTAGQLNISSCSQIKKEQLYGKAWEAFASLASTPSHYYCLIWPYLGGAPAEDLKELANAGVAINMDLSIFLALNPEELQKLSVTDVKRLLGENLPELKKAEHEPSVVSWVQQQFQQELDCVLGIGLQGGRPEPTGTASPAVTTPASVTSMATVTTPAGPTTPDSVTSMATVTTPAGPTTPASVTSMATVTTSAGPTTPASVTSMATVTTPAGSTTPASVTSMATVTTPAGPTTPASVTSMATVTTPAGPTTPASVTSMATVTTSPHPATSASVTSMATVTTPAGPTTPASVTSMATVTTSPHPSASVTVPTPTAISSHSTPQPSTVPPRTPTLSPTPPGTPPHTGGPTVPPVPTATPTARPAVTSAAPCSTHQTATTDRATSPAVTLLSTLLATSSPSATPLPAVTSRATTSTSAGTSLPGTTHSTATTVPNPTSAPTATHSTATTVPNSTSPPTATHSTATTVPNPTSAPTATHRATPAPIPSSTIPTQTSLGSSTAVPCQPSSPPDPPSPSSSPTPTPGSAPEPPQPTSNGHINLQPAPGSGSRLCSCLALLLAATTGNLLLGGLL
ncbi:mesothelin-like protein [Anomalospiza imberbis]|uniref:mesothelin-like protein n=1 Tax=Anomalospiza imberbis TaxID=187417 RepID=UPI00358F7D13